MKRIHFILYLFLSLSFYTQSSFAQFAIVKDSIRGATNLYERTADKGQIKAAMPNGSVVYLYPRDMDILPWRYVDYYLPEGGVERGFVNGDFIEDIRELELVEVERLSAHGSITFRSDSSAVRVVVSTGNVVKGDNTISLKDGRYMVGDKRAMGVFNSFPTQRYQSITATIKGRTVSVSRTLLNYLFEPDLENTAAFYDAATKTVYITSINGSATNSYNVVWAVPSNGKASVYVNTLQFGI